MTFAETHEIMFITLHNAISKFCIHRIVLFECHAQHNISTKSHLYEQYHAIVHKDTRTALCDCRIIYQHIRNFSLNMTQSDH